MIEGVPDVTVYIPDVPGGPMPQIEALAHTWMVIRDISFDQFWYGEKHLHGRDRVAWLNRCKRDRVTPRDLYEQFRQHCLAAFHLWAAGER